jgi:alpha-tubulin suppressor-like RCC1 family protein
VVLRAGKAMSFTVVYATLVPKSTVVVPAGATSSLTGDPSGPRVLTITGSAARAVRVGDSLSSGVTSAAPYGYLVKVTKIAHKSGSSATLDVENTTLLAALPTGEINAEQPLEPTAEAASANDLRRVNLTLGWGLHGSSRAHAAGFTINTENLECETSAGVHLGRPTLTFSPSMAVHASWGFFKLDSASISVTAAESLSFGATADAGAHCSTSSPGIGLFPHPITLGTFDIQVGPVPVTVTPKLQLYLSGQATIEAKATFSLEQGASVTVGASYEHGSFHPISSLSQHFTQAFTAEGDANGEVALTPTVDTLIYDVAGPSFDVGAVAKLNANVKASPWWTLQGCLQAGLGFVIAPLDLNWSDPHLIELCKTLLSASTPPPASAIAASSAPTNTTPPTITDGEGNNPPKVEDTLTASPGAWSGTPTSYVYEWEVCSALDSCTTSFASRTSSFNVPESALGDAVRVTVTASNGAGSSTPVRSTATGVVTGATPIPGANVKAIASDGASTCFLKYEGTVSCVGLNNYGQIGNGIASDVNSTLSISPVSDLSTATAISASTVDDCVILADGQVACWGDNEHGELGIGTETGPNTCETASSPESPCSKTPVIVPGINNATAIEVSGAYDEETTCVVLSTGHVECWGYNYFGSLGDGQDGEEHMHSDIPVEVFGITNAVAVTGDSDSPCALLSTGGVDCWGQNLGDGSEYVTSSSDVPVSVSGITNAVQIGASNGTTCAVLASGHIECWGYDLGNGPPSMEGSTTPVEVPGITDAVSVYGTGDMCALLTTGGVECWGYNETGELGDGNIEDSWTPVPVEGIDSATAVSTGGLGSTACAILSDASVECWGDGYYGQLGDGKSVEYSDVPLFVSGI